MSKERKVANAFVGWMNPPRDAELSSALGTALPVWNRFIGLLASELDANNHEWRSYAAKWGWSLRVKKKARTIVWLEPMKGAFRVTFLLGDRAVEAAQSFGLSTALLAKVNAAKKYPEGRAVRFVASAGRLVPAFMQLSRIKVAN